MSIARLARMMESWRASVRRFAGDKRGVSAVEFAIILPFMAMIYLGGTALTQAIIVKRKVVLVTHAVGDLVARDTILTNAEVTAIFDAAKAVFAPYPWASPQLKIKVTSVEVDQNGNAKVDWSEAFQDTAYAKNNPVTLPAGVNAAKSTVIWAEVSYNFTPPIGGVYTGGMITLRDQLYIRPRLVTKITRQPS